METMYTLDISKHLGSTEYVPVLDDVARMVVIQIMVQFKHTFCCCTYDV